MSTQLFILFSSFIWLPSLSIKLAHRKCREEHHIPLGTFGRKWLRNPGIWLFGECATKAAEADPQRCEIHMRLKLRTTNSDVAKIAVCHHYTAVFTSSSVIETARDSLDSATKLKTSNVVIRALVLEEIQNVRLDCNQYSFASFVVHGEFHASGEADPSRTEYCVLTASSAMGVTWWQKGRRVRIFPSGRDILAKRGLLRFQLLEAILHSVADRDKTDEPPIAVQHREMPEPAIGHHTSNLHDA